jgi:hypothetical protein
MSAARMTHWLKVIGCGSMFRGLVTIALLPVILLDLYRLSKRLRRSLHPLRLPSNLMAHQRLDFKVVRYLIALFG